MAASARLIGEIRGSAFAGSATRRRRPIVIVVGTEHSGASLCSHIIRALGVRIVERATSGAQQSRDNGAGTPRGRADLAALHDRILRLFNGDLGGPGDPLGLPVSWWADPRVREIRRELAGMVDDGIDAGQFGFYDPPTMRLMPVWNQIAKELKLAPKIVHCLRNPAQIARIAQAHGGMPPGLAEYRWFAHTVEFFRHSRKADICTIEYDEWFGDRATNLEKLQRFLGLPDAAELDVEAAVSEIVEQGKPDSDIDPGEARQPLIRSVYRLARRAEHDADARDQLQHIARQLLSFQQLHAGARADAAPGKTDRAGASDGSSPSYCLSPASFRQPEDVVPSAWQEHAPFAFWLIEVLHPGIFVELGTHYGFSYLAFCQAVQRLGGTTKCYAVDTWKGDEHAGFYGEDVFSKLSEIHERRYSGFSRLIRSTFDDALPHFGHGTVDLLHIDGRHRYDDVVHDFESWLPKLSDRAVVLLHDINVRERGFGVWQFWAELQTRFRCFEFVHGHGLGVVQVGHITAGPLRPLLEGGAETKAAIAQIYAELGRHSAASHELLEVKEVLRERDALIATLGRDGAAAREALASAESWARDREATIELMRSDIERLRQATAAASLREEELQRIQRQLGDLRQAVRQAEREAEERSAADAAMRGEIAAALDIARRSSETAAEHAAALELARQRASKADQAAEAAERRRVAELAVMQRSARDAKNRAAAMTGEIAALKTELVESREVGRAAFQALAVSNIGLVYREPRLGWRQAMRRLFGIAHRR